VLDACLIVEGTYPYAPGPAGAWVADLVSGLSTLRFGVVHVGRGRDGPHQAASPVPDHVGELVESFPAEAARARRAAPRVPLGTRLARLFGAVDSARGEAFLTVERFYHSVLGSAARADAPAAGAAVKAGLLELAGLGPGRLTPEDLLDSREAWDALLDLVDAYAPEAPLLDTFLAWQATHAPLLDLLRTRVPRAALYHAIGTGPAALLASLAAFATGAPLLVTEPDEPRPAPPPGPLDAAFFEAIRAFARRTAYAAAAEVIFFSEASLRAAVERGGGPAERFRVVPRGIDVGRYAGLRARGRPTAEKDTVQVALFAPVVPASDVKTFLRAAKHLVERLDLVDLVVAGPTDLDDAYYRECLVEAQMLGVDRVLRFAGPTETRELLQELDCLVLAHAGGADPLVLLEAMAAGVPAVATDTDAARELVEGRTPEDRALGPCGILCPIGDHEAIAGAVTRAIRDGALRARLIAAGEARAERFHRRELSEAAYLETYERLAAGAARRAR
jgi:glycosyltransferase involved in cell wall biosynthesis